MRVKMDSMIPLNRRLLLKEGDNDTDDSSHSDGANVDMDMVVMLAALLCALVAALILNSAIHILLRRRRESMEAASNMPPLTSWFRETCPKENPGCSF